MLDRRYIDVESSGEIPLLHKVSSDTEKSHMLPQMKYSILSISQLCDNKCKALFSEYFCDIRHTGKLIIRGIRDKQNKLWKTPIPTSEDENVAVL